MQEEVFRLFVVFSPIDVPLYAFGRRKRHSASFLNSHRFTDFYNKTSTSFHHPSQRRLNDYYYIYYYLYNYYLSSIFELPEFYFLTIRKFGF